MKYDKKMEKQVRIIQKKRIIEMDIIRSLATIAVVLIHISAYTLVNNKIGVTSLSYSISIILNQLSRFSVPLFALLSGIGLTLSYKKEKGYFYFVFHRVFKIIPLYLIWCFIYIIFIKKGLGLHKYIELIYKGEIMYHLYFVPMIVTLYLLFPIIYRGLKRKLGLFISFLITGGILFSVHYYNVPDIQISFYHKRNILYWIFYFGLGVYVAPHIKEYIDKFKKNNKIFKVLFILGVLGILFESFYSLYLGKTLDYATTFLRPSIILYSIIIAMFLASLKYKRNISTKVLKNISNNSYEVYLSHPFILHFYMEFCKRKGIYMGGLYFEVSSFIILMVGSLIISKITKIIRKKLIN